MQSFWRTRYCVSKTKKLSLAILLRVPEPFVGSAHEFKYRLAYVVEANCVVRYDNEIGKGDHRHVGAAENPYRFTTPDQLIADFQKDIARWNDENSHS